MRNLFGEFYIELESARLRKLNNNDLFTLMVGDFYNRIKIKGIRLNSRREVLLLTESSHSESGMEARIFSSELFRAAKVKEIDKKGFTIGG